MHAGYIPDSSLAHTQCEAHLSISIRMQSILYVGKPICIISPTHPPSFDPQHNQVLPYRIASTKCPSGKEGQQNQPPISIPPPVQIRNKMSAIHDTLNSQSRHTTHVADPKTHSVLFMFQQLSLAAPPRNRLELGLCDNSKTVQDLVYVCVC